MKHKNKNVPKSKAVEDNIYTDSQSKGYTEIFTRAGKISQIPKSLHLTFYVNKLNFVKKKKNKTKPKTHKVW